MAGFVDQITLVNRAPINLTVTFDGVSKTLTPGENLVPSVVVDYAKNQNPIMGTQDPYNPNIQGCRYLVGVKGRDDCAKLTQDEWEEHLRRPCREDEQEWFANEYGNDPKAKLVTRGKGRSTAAGNRAAAADIPKGISEFTSKA